MENDSSTTPKQTKRLGLRRSRSSIIKNMSATKVAKNDTIELPSPASTSRRRLVQSDVKVNYKRLVQSDNETTPCTPENLGSTDLQRLAVSTNCRPYRLALSKRVRERMTKKRLEFYLANEMERTESEDKQQQETDKVINKFKSRDELVKQIEIARKELEAREEHLKKVEDLQQAIKIWKTGFSSALHDLQRKLEPRLEFTTLLQQLNIPQEMIKYIDD